MARGLRAVSLAICRPLKASTQPATPLSQALEANTQLDPEASVVALEHCRICVKVYQRELDSVCRYTLASLARNKALESNPGMDFSETWLTNSEAWDWARKFSMQSQLFQEVHLFNPVWQS